MYTLVEMNLVQKKRELHSDKKINPPKRAFDTKCICTKQWKSKSKIYKPIGMKGETVKPVSQS
jgi:hypothetical protein